MLIADTNIVSMYADVSLFVTGHSKNEHLLSTKDSKSGKEKSMKKCARKSWPRAAKVKTTWKDVVIALHTDKKSNNKK